MKEGRSDGCGCRWGSWWSSLADVGVVDCIGRVCRRGRGWIGWRELSYLQGDRIVIGRIGLRVVVGSGVGLGWGLVGLLDGLDPDVPNSKLALSSKQTPLQIDNIIIVHYFI